MEEARPPSALESRRRTHVGLRVHWIRECGSTNDEAFARLESEGAGASGVAIFADRQTSGRGRRGRRWFASAGRGILLSVGLRPSRVLPAPAWVAATAVAVREAVANATGLTARVKWPNDLMISGRKVCGILVEARGAHVVLGIGINVKRDAGLLAEPALARTAISLEEAAERSLERMELAAAVLDSLDMAVGELSAGGFARLERAFLEGLDFGGGRVRAVGAGGAVAGEILSIRFDQGVTLRTVNGVVTLPAETLTSLSLLDPKSLTIG